MTARLSVNGWQDGLPAWPVSAWLAVTGIYIAIIVLTLIVSLLFTFNCDLKTLKRAIDATIEGFIDYYNDSIKVRKSSKLQTLDDTNEVDHSTQKESQKSNATTEDSEDQNMKDIRQPAIQENKDEGDGDSKKPKVKNYLFVNDLSRNLRDPTKSRSVYKRSKLFLGILFLVSIIYSLPTLQMVFAFSDKQGESGNQDICYFNDLCRKPLGRVRDFNHVLSNLGYCAFGLLFMAIVLIKHMYHIGLAKNKHIGEVICFLFMLQHIYDLSYLG